MDRQDQFNFLLQNIFAANLIKSREYFFLKEHIKATYEINVILDDYLKGKYQDMNAQDFVHWLTRMN